jgi:hypothetical protein
VLVGMGEVRVRDLVAVSRRMDLHTNKCNTTNRRLGRGSRSQALTPRGGVTVSLRPRLARAGRYLGRHRWAEATADEAGKRVTVTTTITTTTKPEDRRQEHGSDRAAREETVKKSLLATENPATKRPVVVSRVFQYWCWTARLPPCRAASLW